MDSILRFQEKYLVPFSCCIPVKGSVRSTICDLQRGTFDFIPNILYTILTRFRNKPLKAIIEYCGPENLGTLKEYMDFLIKKEYVFLSGEPERFPALSLDWKTPFDITNAIVDFDDSSNHDTGLIFKQLEELRCPVVQLRFYSSPANNVLEKMLSQLEGTGIRTVEIILKYSKDFTPQKLDELITRFPRISGIRVTSSPEDIFASNKRFGSNIVFTTQIVDSAQCCGIISPANFAVNLQLFTESQKLNSCLNRKIGIDVAGNIKNCPTSTEKHGHINSVKLADVVGKKSFRKIWSVAKDSIAVCQDCEFRHICVDCRMGVSKINSKPLKCKYDPYTATWEK